MKVVLDTNILASGAISPAGTVSRILDEWRSGTFRVIVSSPMLAELERTLQKPYFRRYLTKTQSYSFLKLLQRQVSVSPITVSVHEVATHPEDDVILATAVSDKADYLVTGDTKLQGVRTYNGVTILSPKQFLAILTHGLAKE
jgi:putative PIN family toxin of toxin-antitoxin system